MSSLRDARVANLDCRLIKKKKEKKKLLSSSPFKNRFPPSRNRPFPFPVSFKDVDDEISKDFVQISRF